MAEPQSFINDPEELVLRYLDNPRPDLKDLIMLRYTAMVERIARRFAGIESAEDLTQVGFIGLINALSKFDPMAGVRFNTYATHLVAGEIKHYLRDRSQTIRQPAWLQELRHKVNRASSALQAKLSRVPTEREIADELGVSESAVQDVFSTHELLKVGSLDAPVASGDDNEGEIDRLESECNGGEHMTVENRVVLESAISQLRDLEQQVLVLFHFETLNQTEIAQRLGISCNYVSHILRQSLAKLRRILTAEEHNDQLLRRQGEHAGCDLVDTLTGAYTENYIRSRLVEEIHRAGGSESMVGLLEVEFQGLQKLRDYYGPDSVIDFIADAADFLKASVRRLDVVGRLGDTGFAIICPSTGPTIALVEKRLSESLAKWLAGRQAPSGPISFQVGHAHCPHDARSADQMFAAAASSMSPSQKAA